MNKETLNHYGWIVISVVILSIMIALASPFAMAIKNSVVGTTNVFVGHANNALKYSFEEHTWESIGGGSSNKQPSITPGLYQTGSDYTEEPNVSWEKLLADGIVTVENGVVSTNLNTDDWTNASSNALIGELVLPDDGSVKKLGNAYWDDDEYTYVGDVAFAYCTNLTGIVIPDSVTEISAGAFEGCANLKSINFPASLTDIGEYIFFDCVNIENVEVAKGIDNFDLHVFYGCDKLVTIVFTGTVEECNEVLTGMAWNTRVHTVYIQCSDGQIVFEYEEPV